MKTASTLPTFTPAYGHTYMPHTRATDTTAAAAQQTSQQSKETTPIPEVSDSQAAGKAGLGVSTTSSSYQDTRSLAEAINLLTRYGDEYMDENPLVGEPGSFILSRNGGETDRAAGPAKPASNKITGATTTGTSTPSGGPPGRVSTPQVRVETPGKASDKSSTPPSSAEHKGKRKKSKAVANS